MDFNLMMNYMMNMIMMKFMFNELPHALGLLESFDTDASKLESELHMKAYDGHRTLDIEKPRYIGMSDPVSVEEGLKQSMREESTAIAKYGTRAAHARLNGDIPTAELYDKVRPDENNHYTAFGTRLRERLSGNLTHTDALKLV
jgi:rubrerythrin